MKKSSDRLDSFLVSSLLFKHIPFYQNESKTHPAMPVKYWVGKTSLILLVLFTLSHCAYSPVVDSRGNNGKNVAHRLTDDIQTCKAIAEQNTSNFVEAYKAVYNYYFRPAVLWLPDKMEFKYKNLVKKCLTNRGHSVLDWLKERRKIWQKIIKNGMRTKDNLIIV